MCKWDGESEFLGVMNVFMSYMYSIMCVVI